MKYNTYTLDNGLRIIHLPSDSKVVYCGYQINAGTRNEEPGEEGLAHLLSRAQSAARRGTFSTVWRAWEAT